MTPRELDPGVVQARLRLIEELLDDLDHVDAVTAGALECDRASVDYRAYVRSASGWLIGR